MNNSSVFDNESIGEGASLNSRYSQFQPKIKVQEIK